MIAKNMSVPKQQTHVKVPSPVRAFVLSGALITLDAVWLGQGVIAAFVAIWLIMISVPRSFLARYAPVRALRLRNIAIYLGAVAVVVAFNVIDNRVAQARSEKLVAAVEAFHAKAGFYPRSLQELVPTYLDSVPRAKYSLAFNQFMYWRTQESAFLMYVSMPPFGRPTYSFSEKRWSYID